MSSVLLVSFCVKSPISFANIKEKWIPEVRHRCPNTPVLLVGLQCDLFNSERHVFTPEIEINGDYPVPREDALQLAKDIGEEFITLFITVRTLIFTYCHCYSETSLLLVARIKLYDDSVGEKRK